VRLLLGEEEPAVPWGEAPVVTLEPGEGEKEDALAMLWAELPDAHLLPSFLPTLPGMGQAPPAAPAVVPALRAGGTILFDLETLRGAADVGGWRNIHRMGVAIGVLCHLEEGRFEVFGEAGVRALCDALRGASRVIGFNVKRFDYRVLAGYTGEDYERICPTLDLLEDVHARLGFRVGMGHLAAETLGLGKSADGLQSLEWVRQEGRRDPARPLPTRAARGLSLLPRPPARPPAQALR